MIDLRKYVKIAFTILLSVLLLLSCKSGKMAIQGKSGLRLTGEEQLEAVMENTPVFDSFSSRLRLTIPLKKEEYTLNGTLKIQYDRLIQISLLLPIIRTEAVRIEISPENILIIDRMNRRYASVPASELHEVFHTEVDFPMLQSLFSNTIFLPGQYGLTRKDYSSFQAQSRENDGVQLSCESREFVYSFLTSLETHRLVSSSIETHSSSYRLQWEYDNFVPVGETTFPSKMKVLVGKKDNPGRATLELSRLSVNEQTLTPTNVPARYESVRLSDILRMLEGL
jgi:hypothetical protein